jgi:uncharacterized protein (DUF58 family)
LGILSLLNHGARLMNPSELPAELVNHPLEIAVRRLADDLCYGQDASPYVGAGIDFVQSRPYVDDDSIKDIDWRVTARAGRMYVKQYETLKTMPVYLVVDTSASMAVSSTPLSKYQMATLIAGAIGLAALHRLSPVGLLGCGAEPLHFRPSLSRSRVFQWLHALATLERGREERGEERGTGRGDIKRSPNGRPSHAPSPSSLRSPVGSAVVGERKSAASLAEPLARLCTLLKTGSLVVVVSDLHDSAAVPVIKRVAQRHEEIVLRLEDPAERGLLRAGLFRGAEAETGRTFVAHGRSRWFAGADDPGKELRKAGIDYAVLATDRPLIPPLRRLLADRGGLIRNTR